MKSKFKVLIVIITLAFSLSIMSNTYSRYVADATGDVELTFAKWQILINNNDITNEETRTIAVTPTILANENVAANKLAPSSIGYYDIEIDPTNVETSFNYQVTISDIEEMPDLLITKYQIIIDGVTTEYEIEDNTIEGTLNYGDEDFDVFTLRIFFEWYDEEGNTMSDEDDTTLSEQETISIETNITFEQKING